LDEIGDGGCQSRAGLCGVGGPVKAKADGDSLRLKIDVETGEVDAAEVGNEALGDGLAIPVDAREVKPGVEVAVVVGAVAPVRVEREAVNEVIFWE
jgi:hypothetical protein